MKSIDLSNIILSLEKYSSENNGQIPRDWFEKMPIYFPQAAIELGIIKEINNSHHIFLAQRPADDPYWPSEWHLPGTVLRHTDTEKTIWKRLLSDEVDGIIQPSEAKLIDTHISSKQDRERGACVHSIYLAKTNKDIKSGKFFPIIDLPKNTIKHHLPLIEKIKKSLK